MKKSIFLFISLLAGQFAYGQSVGVGTTTPDASAKLEVSSTTQGMLVPRMTTAQRTTISSPASGLLVFDLTTNSFWFKGGSSWVELVDSVNTEIHRNGPNMIYTGITDNVGVGTTTPAYKLDVKTEGAFGYGISHTNGTIDVTTYVENGFAGFIGTRSNHPFQLYANDGANQFTLLPAGNVGIGLNNPSQKLHVAGNLAVNNYVGIGNADPHASLQFDNNTLLNRKIVLYEGVNNEHQFFGLGINSGILRYQVSNTNDKHVFYAGTSSSASKELMRIQGNGNVGIDISNPLNRLDVAASFSRTGIHATGRPLYVTGDLWPSGNGIEFRHSNGSQGIGFGYNTMYAAGSNPDQDLGLKAKGTSGNLIFSTNENERMRITGDGLVGIGISNPGAMLEITRGTAPFGNLQLNGTQYNSHFNFGSTEDTYIRGGKTFGKVIINDYGDLGNVGIGTDNPLQKLHVGGNLFVNDYVGIGNPDPHAPLHFGNVLESRKIILLEVAQNETEFNGFGVNPGQLRYQSTGDHAFYFGAPDDVNLELMRMTSSGRVGIGITNPDATLEIARGTAPYGNLQANGTNYNSHFNYGIPEDTYIRGGKPGAKVIINEFPTHGNVGIGTASPLQKLHVGGSLAVDNNVGIANADPHAPLQFSNDLQNRKIVLYEGANNDHQYYGLGVNGSIFRYQVSNTGDNHIFYAGNTTTSSNELMRIRGNGNVDVAGALEIGYVRVFGSFTNVPGFSYGSASCNCPAGLVVLGGGFNVSDNAIEIIKSYANGDSSWYVYLYNSGGATRDLQAFAICARLAN